MTTELLNPFTSQQLIDELVKRGFNLRVTYFNKSSACFHANIKPEECEYCISDKVKLFQAEAKKNLQKVVDKQNKNA